MIVILVNTSLIFSPLSHTFGIQVPSYQVCSLELSAVHRRDGFPNTDVMEYRRAVHLRDR